LNNPSSPAVKTKAASKSKGFRITSNSLRNSSCGSSVKTRTRKPARRASAVLRCSASRFLASSRFSSASRSSSDALIAYSSFRGPKTSTAIIKLPCLFSPPMKHPCSPRVKEHRNGAWCNPVCRSAATSCNRS